MAEAFYGYTLLYSTFMKSVGSSSSKANHVWWAISGPGGLFITYV